MKLQVLTPILFNGFVDWVRPWRIREGEQFYMLGDHGCFCPINFEQRS